MARFSTDPDGFDTDVADFIAGRRARSDEVSWITPTGVEPSIEVLTDLLDEYAGGASPVRIADVGCGGGFLTAEVAETHPDATVLGIDLAPEAYRTAQQRFAGRDDVIVVGGNACEVLPEVDPFDFVYAINVVNDTASPVRTIRTLARSLTEDGTLAMTLPGQRAIELFPEFAHHDDDVDLPYMAMEEIVVDGKTTSWKQYAFPDARVEEMARDCGLRIVERDELAADATGLLYPMELLEDDERIEWARSLVQEQEDRPEAGPTVPLYVLRRTESA